MSTAVEPIVAHAPTKPVPITADQIQLEKVTLCSVYPVERRLARRHNTHTEYIMPAAPRDSYSLLTVYRTFEWITMHSDEGPSYSQRAPGPIDAMTVAQDLVNNWSKHTIASKAGHGPGIGIIRGDSPTESELGELRERQRACFEWLIKDANDKHTQGETKNISDPHRFAAKWMYGDSAERLPWYPKIEQPDAKDCPACAKQIKSKALRCEFCSVDLADFYLQYGIPADPYVAEISAKRAPKPLEPALKSPRL